MSQDPDLIDLWPDGPPDQDIVHTGPEQTVNRDVDQNADGLNRAISNVSTPGLYLYPCDQASATGDVVLVIPGGGYHHVTVDKEGHDVARWLNGIGISAAVLKYRTRPEGHPRTKDIEDPVLNAILRDGQEAMRVIRARSAEWGFKRTRLGAMGFSAGSHLSIRLAMSSSADADSRPDFLALLYSAVPSGAGDAVDKTWPPTFVAHAGDDTTTPIEGVLDFYRGCRREQIPTEMHIYPTGGHAFGLGVRGGGVADWPNRFANWISTK